jgi:hypothetical protein
MTILSTEGWRGSTDTVNNGGAVGGKASLNGWTVLNPGSYPIITVPSGTQTMKVTSGGNGITFGGFYWAPRKPDGTMLAPGDNSGGGTFVLGFRATWSLTPANSIFECDNSTGQLLFWLKKSGTAIQIMDRSGSVLATSTATPLDGAEHYYEIKATVGYPARIVLHLDGTQIADSGTGWIISPASGPTDIGYFRWFTSAGSAVTLSDIVLLDTNGSAPTNDFLGDVHVETKMPTGDGTHTDFAPSPAGTHYTTVDERPSYNGDTDYVQSTAVGDKDTYTHEAMISSGTVYGVAVYAVGEATDTGTRKVKGLVRSGSSEVTGSEEVALAYADYYHLLGVSGVSSLVRGVVELDPQGGGAWTTARVDASEIGVSVSA